MIRLKMKVVPVKIKYKYNIYNLLDSYPTAEDILFDIVNFLREKNINIESEWSDIGVKGAFSKKIPEEDMNEFLRILVDDGFLNMRNGSGKRNYYTIVIDKLKF